MTPADLPRPERTRHSAPFLDGLAAGRLLLPRCASCQRVAHPAIPRCRHCLASEFRWEPASGIGTLYSHVVIHKSFHPAFTAPYEICVIELDEGPRLIGQLVGITADQLGTDAPVRVDLEASGIDGIPLLFVAASE